MLATRGVTDKVAHIVEKTWRKKGRSVAAQVAAAHPTETPPLVLQHTDWRLHLEMGHSKLAGQSQPTAIFQMEMADTSSSMNEVRTEKLDVELSHAELHALFLQLNAIQTELDAPMAPSAP
ncbi:hypothetical protein BBJ28_00011333 [Nothophytophthora sp. Chile5]|nr:hypothetical protein BBJ28_00011333 [Nothophytophthora sp. Chile5]